MHRLARIFPDTSMTYQGWTIPPNVSTECCPVARELTGHKTPISFSVSDMHENPAIFPEPQKFIPERWLTADEDELARLKSNWWPFSKGSRNCVGIK